VNNEAAKVVYPKGMDSAAARVAAVIDYLYRNDSTTIGSKHRKISVVLQPDVNFSNAYVQLGPWRSEFFMMPPQNPFTLGTIRWEDNLAIHEFRHVQQYSNFNVGFSKVLGILAGENGRALANGGSVPDWFFEGDAVWNETVFTEQGRGRLPFFMSSYKTVFNAGRNYSFMKMRNGSLRQYVPNHYELGYLLVAYGRQQYGDSVWKDISRKAAAYHSLFYPWQGAFKKSVGLNYQQFVRDAMSDFCQKSSQQVAVEPKWISASSPNNVINYQYPYPVNDGGTIALKTSFRDIPRFVKIDANGKEKMIAIKHIGYDDYYSYRNGRIVYAALQPDTRWGNRDYSVLKMLDTKSGKTITITGKTRFFSPDVNEEGTSLVAVEIVPGKASQLVLVDREGSIKKRFSADSSFIYSHPKFINSGKEVVAAIRRPDGKMGWLIWTPSNNESRWLLPIAERLVGFPVVQDDYLSFTASEGGTDALYRMNLKSGQRELLQQYTTGVYQGFVLNEEVVATYFTAGGFRLGVAPFNAAPILQGQPKFISLYAKAFEDEAATIQSLPASNVGAAKYKKATRPLNFHSWQPELNEPDYTLRLLGNNVLNTFASDLFYTYNTNENSHAAGVNLTYGGWYVQPIAGVKQTWGREVVYNRDTTFVFNEATASAGLQLPLNLSGGEQYRFLTLSSTVNYNNVRWQGIGEKILRDQDFTFLRTRLVYTGQIQKARQHIFPRFAQSLVADYRTMIDDNNAWQMLLSGSLYLPGLWKNHSLVLTAAWQGRDTARQYSFSNSFPFSRGYEAANYPRMWRLGVNYHFPIVYPEWGFGQLLYFLRIRGNGFFDYTVGKSLRTGQTRNFNSTGAELYFDTRVWNQIPITFGIRYSRLLDSQLIGPTQPNQWEFILPINLF
jgi:hypothetical protein